MLALLAEADELQAKVCGWKAGIKGEEVQCCVPRWLLHKHAIV